VSAKLAAEIHQNKPFAHPEEEALLNLVRTHEFLSQRQTGFFKQFQLTPTQYNILRILRGAGKDGVTCSRASERMVKADPDITRLFDRLEARKLLQRERSAQDRRVVVSRITAEGLKLVDAIDEPLAELHKRCMGRIGRKKLAQLIEILESLREE
jgi:DNA-binding MarR family transcriptional regulator